MPEIVIYRTAPTAAELGRMYQEAGWFEEPDLQRMGKAVQHPSEWFVARRGDGSLLGIGRIITDYVHYAFIVDVIVAEAERGSGVGTLIMEAILAECRSIGVDSIHLWPSKGKTPFYERFGFHALPAYQPHMTWRAQQGAG